MNLCYNLSPLAAVVVAQAEGINTLAVYGPMGVICAWLMWRDEKRASESQKLREEIGGVVHQIKGLNRNLLYVTASYGPEGLKEVAKKELERISQ